MEEELLFLGVVVGKVEVEGLNDGEEEKFNFFATLLVLGEDLKFGSDSSSSFSVNLRFLGDEPEEEEDGNADLSLCLSIRASTPCPCPC